MSFHPIVIGANTFNEAQQGRYMDSSVSFGDPVSYIKISGGTTNKKTGITSAAVTRVVEKDVTVGADSIRRQLNVSMVIQVQPGFLEAEVDSAIGEISTFATSTILARILHGEA